MTDVTRTPIRPPGNVNTAICTQHNTSPGMLLEPGGRLLILSGACGVDAELRPVGGPEEQFVQAFEIIGELLEDAGGTFDDVVDAISFHVGFEHYEKFEEVKDRYITGPVYPSWTGIGVTSLIVPGLYVEVRCTAYLA